MGNKKESEIHWKEPRFKWNNYILKPLLKSLFQADTLELMQSACMTFWTCSGFNSSHFDLLFKPQPLWGKQFSQMKPSLAPEAGAIEVISQYDNERLSKSFHCLDFFAFFGMISWNLEGKWSYRGNFTFRTGLGYNSIAIVIQNLAWVSPVKSLFWHDGKSTTQFIFESINSSSQTESTTFKSAFPWDWLGYLYQYLELYSVVSFHLNLCQTHKGKYNINRKPQVSHFQHLIKEVIVQCLMRFRIVKVWWDTWLE